MKLYRKYIGYILKHKYYVLLECWKHGLYWQGIIHDMSKFSRSEFKQYAKWFNDPEGIQLKLSEGDEFVRFPSHEHERFPITTKHKKHTILRQDFYYAWLHHQNNNKHHWQYWLLNEDDGDLIVLRMPKKYVIEMYCDWIGAGKAINGKSNIKEWYDKNKNKMKLHHKTRSLIESMIF